MRHHQTLLLCGLLSGLGALTGPGAAPAAETSGATATAARAAETARSRDAFGPLYYQARDGETRVWASPPLFSYTLNEDVDFAEFDFLYPAITYDRFGPEYRFQIAQWFSFSGGKFAGETNVSRFTLFPLYFQQRSPIPEKNYTALFPLYGELQNRFFRDEIDFILWPGYVKTRRGDVVTENYLYPIYHRRSGPGLRGWQVWPLVGNEHKEVTYRTNMWDEAELVPGHDRRFILWPIYLQARLGVGTDNPESHQAVLPLYSSMKSPLRDSTTAPWPIGVTYTVDRGRRFTQVGAPWPIIVFAWGDGKTVRRVWPLYSRAQNTNQESAFVLWPVYKYNRFTSAPLNRERTRILFFLYSDTIEENLETGTARHRIDLWPLFTSRRDFDGSRTFQILSLLEPLLPNNKSIDRNYSPIWALWRAEDDPQAGRHSRSLLWDLYRSRTTPETKEHSFLFGLVKYRSGPAGRHWRVFYVPFGDRP